MDYRNIGGEIGTTATASQRTTVRRCSERGAITALALSGSLACLCLSAAPAVACGPACSPLYPAHLLRGAASTVLVELQNDALQVGDVKGPAGTPVPLNIKYQESKPSNATSGSGSLFIFRGIPAGLKLNFGGDFGDFWAVNSKVFDRLTITAASGMSGTFEIQVTRAAAAAAGEKKKTDKFVVTIVDADEGQRMKTAATPLFLEPGRPRAEDVPPVRKPIDNPADTALRDRAMRMLAMGDISGARTVFEYLVTKGHADAAIAVGGTYDPAVLGQLFVKGVDADLHKARAWYEKAREMGSSDAGRRLQALSDR